MRRLATIAAAFATTLLPLPPGEGRGEGGAQWTPVAAQGVEVKLGPSGDGVRVDFDFAGRAGWAGARLPIARTLPEHFELRLDLWGEALPNTLEVKLIESIEGGGENVWWVNRREFELPRERQTLRFKRRHFSFAWGPRGGGEVQDIDAVEIVLTAGEGGRGTLWIGEIEIVELPPPPAPPQTPPVVSGDGRRHLFVDFGGAVEFGGLFLRWALEAAPLAYAVDGLARVDATNGGEDWLYLPESEAETLQLTLEGCPPAGCRLEAIEALPLAAGASPNAFFERVAAKSQPGDYPRAFAGEQSYWTVVGADGAAEEALLGEDGALELEKGGPSLEPFLWLDGALVSWSGVEKEHRLLDGRLPIPTVVWRTRGVELEITAFAEGPIVRSRYRVRSSGPPGPPGPPESGARKGALWLALRPLQVNPPTQFLGAPGGVGRLDRVAGTAAGLRWSAGRREGEIVTAPAPEKLGATTFDGGGIVEFLRSGTLPPAASAEDPRRWASAAMRWDFDPTEPGGSEVWIATGRADPTEGERRLAAAAEAWRHRLRSLELRLPAAALHESLLPATLGWILVHRDGPALRPGSRAYERSWIRDGALTSEALLRAGLEEEARSFIEWYAGYQYPNGAVPCCVDPRGADPVPEHDSHGELIHAVAQVWRYTRDREFLARLFPPVERAVQHLDELRRSRRTAAYRDTRYFGLLPESISHEGYSAKPVHSYWDAFFGLRGYQDAVELAEALGEREKAAGFARSRDEFAADLHASIRRSIAEHGIDFIPGSADLGDYDATSTTIALAPGGEFERLPQPELRATFERYWQEFTARRAATDESAEWDAYTPYELRNVGAFVRLGWRDRAHELLAWFLEHLRPAGWNQWAEVVGRKEREPRFLGDMPHGWVGSDYIRSFLDLFAYERESDQSLVIGAGIPEAWLADGGCALRGLHTRYGVLDLEMERRAGVVEVRLGTRDGWRQPPGGIVVAIEGAVLKQGRNK